MPVILITDEAEKAVRGAAEKPFRNEGEKLPDGMWKVHLEWETVEGLRRYKQEGESLSDVIIRLLATQKGVN